MVIKKSATTDEIISAFITYRNIQFTKNAIYKIKSTLYVRSNTVVDLNGATLRRYTSRPVLMTYGTTKTKNYDGAHDIIIKNGTIEGMNGLGYTSSNLTALFHAKNITFENVTFLDAVGSHCVDIVGCKNVTIKNCKFLGYCSTGNDFREAIQIDCAYHGGLPYYAKGSTTYDMTKCNTITIEGCTFDKSKTYPAQYCAIGAHEFACSGSYHENINVLNNIANGNGEKNNQGFFLRIMNFRNVLVKGNTVNNYARFVYLHMPTCLRDKDTNKLPITGNEKFVNNLENITIDNNTVTKAPNCRYVAYAVYIDNKVGYAGTINVTNLKNVPANAVCVSKCQNVNIKL